MGNLNWSIVYTKQGLKDKKRACESGLANKDNDIIGTLKDNPYTDYSPYEKLIGDLKGAYSRRIDGQHRVVYQIYNEERTVKIISM